MSDFSKKQIFKSDSNNIQSNASIRLKTNACVVIGSDNEQKLVFVDEVKCLKSDGKNADLLSFLKSEYPFNSSAFASTKIIYPNCYFTLVPKMYFDENHLKSYFLHAINMKDQHEFDYSFSELSYEMMCVNALEKSYLNELKVSFPNAHLFSETESMIKVCKDDFLTRIQDNKTYLYLFFSDNKCDILLFVEGKLMIANRISFNSIENFIYHILNTLQQSGQFAEQTEVILLGEIEKQSAIVLGLSRYFQRIHFLSNQRNNELEGTSYNYALETFLL
ncbi:MAG: DUF3822 family protein [Bacteroidales bacterium]|nr:DUF3822 family protein [Bacteroidales bacterium]